MQSRSLFGQRLTPRFLLCKMSIMSKPQPVGIVAAHDVHLNVMHELIQRQWGSKDMAVQEAV